MLLRSAFGKWIFDGRRSILAWTLSIAGVGGMYAAFWPTIDNPSMRQALEGYPDFLLEALNFQDVATPAGYLNATVYGLVVGILILVYAITAGARAIAGDEEAGTLDLVLAHPIGRDRLMLQRFAALVTSLVGISLGLLVVILALVGPADLSGISLAQFLAMHLHLALFGTLFGSIAYGVGAATGRRALGLGVGSAVAVFGFAANGILNQVEGLEWVEGLSPFEWLNGGSPLQNGPRGGDLLAMAVLTLVFVAIGLWGFGRRDVAV